MAKMGDQTILILEDDEDLGATIKFALTKAGYHVMWARNGKDGLKQVARQVPNVIVLDIQMPIMGGREFASIFRDQYGSGVPIIVLTAADNARGVAEEIGAQGCIEKPMRMSTLFRVLERHLAPVPEPPPASER